MFILVTFPWPVASANVAVIAMSRRVAARGNLLPPKMCVALVQPAKAGGRHRGWVECRRRLGGLQSRRIAAVIGVERTPLLVAEREHEGNAQVVVGELVPGRPHGGKGSAGARHMAAVSDAILSEFN
jgi:hypothetical protein